MKLLESNRETRQQFQEKIANEQKWSTNLYSGSRNVRNWDTLQRKH
jgi:hypothetical protein